MPVVFAQNPVSCSEYFDLRLWEQYGDSEQNWTFSSDGTSGNQSNNGEPSFLINNANLINVRVKGKLNVQTNYDNDYIGFVFGYQNPNTSTQDTNQYFLVDWSKGANNLYDFDGFSLVEVDTVIPAGFSDPPSYQPLFWQRNSLPGFNILQEGDPRRWESYTEYEFTLEYTTSRILVIISGGDFEQDTVINHEGCFQPGRVGFFNYSQGGAEYSDFTYEHIADFGVPISPLCLGSPFNFNASGCVANNYYTNSSFDFKWFLGQDSVLENVSDFSFIFNERGTHEVKLVITDENSCQDSITKTIEVNAPNISLGNDSSICSGDTLQISATATGGVGVLTGEWEDGSSGFSRQVSDSGSYVITVTDSLGCSTRDTISITEHQLPEIVLTEPSMICEGNPAMVMDSVGFMDRTLTWTPNPMGVNSNGITLLNLSSGEHLVHLHVEDEYGCESEDSTTVTVVPQIEVEMAERDSLCPGDTLQISATATGGVGVLTGEWADGSSGFSRQVNDSGSYVITVTDSLGCSTRDTISITEHQLPEIVLTEPSMICEGNPVMVMDSVGFMDRTLTWTPNPMGVNSNGITLLNLSSGEHLVHLRVEDEHGCESEDSTTVTVVPQIEVEMAERDSLCPGDTLQISATATGGVGVLTGEWADGSSGFSRQVNDSGSYVITVTDSLGCSTQDTLITQFYSISSIGLGDEISLCQGSDTLIQLRDDLSYVWSNGAIGNTLLVQEPYEEIELVATDSNACKTRDTLIINWYAKPQVTLPNDTLLCLDEFERLTIQAQTSNVQQFIWSTGGRESNIDVSNSGDYWLQVLDVNGCESSDTIEVVIDSIPELELGLTLNEEQPCFRDYPNGVILEATPELGSLFEYRWSTNEQYRWINIDQAGVYELEVSYFTCKKEFNIEIQEQCAIKLFIPNAFTPNDDYLNDVFKPLGEDAEKYEVVIFDRWGTIVFQSNNFNEGWNGKMFNTGKKLPIGIYVYKISYQKQKGNGFSRDFVQTGTVTLMR